MRVRDTRSLVPRAYGTNRSNLKTHFIFIFVIFIPTSGKDLS
jgi:uncharacterized membrane protein YGL010W